MSHGLGELCRFVRDGPGPGENKNRHTCFRIKDHEGAHKCLCCTSYEQNPSGGPDTPQASEEAGEGQ